MKKTTKILVTFTITSQLMVLGVFLYSVNLDHDAQDGKINDIELSSTDEKFEISYILYYFPQFYPFKENNDFWGDGYTEFTNIKKIKMNRWGEPIIRPSKFFDLRDKKIREQESIKLQKINAELIYHFYWFDRPVMDEVLKLRLVDGHPNTTFMLNWANEPWSKKWDGGNNNILIPQDYFKYSTYHDLWMFLRPFFLNTQYKLYRGCKLLSFYKMNNIPNICKLKKYLNAELIKSGSCVSFMFVRNTIYNNLGNVEPICTDLVSEFEPNYSGLDFTKKHSKIKLELNKKVHFGLFVDWDNSPRHIRSKMSFTTHSQNMYFFERTLIESIRSSVRLRGYNKHTNIFINAWNEWSEKSSLSYEPYYEKFLSIVERITKIGVFGVIIRSYHKHVDGLYKVSDLIEYFIKMDYPLIKVYVMDLDYPKSSELHDLIKKYDDPRIEYHFGSNNKYDKYYTSGYDSVDALIHNLPEYIKHIIVTNGDNIYESLDLWSIDDSKLNYMNYYSRWNIINEDLHDEAVIMSMQSCKRITKLKINEFTLGKTELGAVIINVRMMKELNLKFMNYKCPTCQDAFFIKELRSSYDKINDIGVLIHQPIKESCIERHGIWFQSNIIPEINCYSFEEFNAFVEKNKLFIKGLKSVDYETYKRGDNCVTYNLDYQERFTIDYRERFNKNVYSSLNPDVVGDPVTHWVNYGVKENRHFWVNSKYKMRLPNLVLLFEWNRFKFLDSVEWVCNDPYDLLCLDYLLIELPSILHNLSYDIPEFVLYENISLNYLSYIYSHRYFVAEKFKI